MKTDQHLLADIKKLNKKSYSLYKSLQGSYQYDCFVLHIDHVQGDPYAAPSRLRVEISKNKHHFPAKFYDYKAMEADYDHVPFLEEFQNKKLRKTTLEDQILRKFHRVMRYESSTSKKWIGSGKSGLISTCPVGQKVMERVAVLADAERIEFRLEMGFPAQGRSILASEMEKMILQLLPNLIRNTFLYDNWSKKEKKALEEAIALCDNQYAIRQMLEEKNLLAFIADGAILPRANGISDLPMKEAIPFQSTIANRVTMKVPHGKPLSGMGFRPGITTVVGGGYHGKSTLLKALEHGVYNHIGGDGREYVLTIDDAMKIRAEDGRQINHTDISMFINHLPSDQDTQDFCTQNASGSTSQAANLVEALESGSRLLFIDEDTSATNFMIRDIMMSALIADDKDPITPLIRNVQKIHQELGVSFIIVGGSSGEYFGSSDYVFQMDQYRLYDVTEKAQVIYRNFKKQFPTMDSRKPNISMPEKNRIMEKKFVPIFVKMKAVDTDTLVFDREAIDIRYVEQLCDQEQTAGLAYAISWIFRKMKGPLPMAQAVDLAIQEMDQHGLIHMIDHTYSCGHPARPRRQEIHACLNRFRSLGITK